ncbi:hypothetical protein ATANTOWER_009864 [Ataeniobius toweri]|uniref:Uncharacterized protein n=1 Tax=Ataeniobius toweri TaxID=208326 RepID=A0ABU7AQH3_9TELE|nr:hypothetical protein [Ataeniobius toweri]
MILGQIRKDPGHQTSTLGFIWYCGSTHTNNTIPRGVAIPREHQLSQGTPRDPQRHQKGGPTEQHSPQAGAVWENPGQPCKASPPLAAMTVGTMQAQTGAPSLQSPTIHPGKTQIPLIPFQPHSVLPHSYPHTPSHHGLWPIHQARDAVGAPPTGSHCQPQAIGNPAANSSTAARSSIWPDKRALQSTSEPHLSRAATAPHPTINTSMQDRPPT